MRYFLISLFLIPFLAFASSVELKKIQNIYQSNVSHMVGDGFKVFNYFPNGPLSLQDVSPFVLLDYNAPTTFAPSAKQRGVGAHPHRGFETVTIVYEGALAHRDSYGGAGVIGKGDVQWMTAASGVLHEEFHEKNFAKSGGTLHAVQLWVNLPAKDKMSAPKYQTLLNQEIGHFKIDEKGSFLRVIAGNFQGVKGAASTFTPIEVYDVQLKKGSMLDFELPAAYNTMLLVMQGRVEINQKEAKVKDFIFFTHQGEGIHLKALEDCLLLVLSGEPILEPVVQSGPFVMNTQKEIKQAQKDFKTGKFGKL